MRSRPSSLPIAKNEAIPGLLTTENSWFENYAAQKIKKEKTRAEERYSAPIYRPHLLACKVAEASRLPAGKVQRLDAAATFPGSLIPAPHRLSETLILTTYAEPTHIRLVDRPGAEQSEIRVGRPGLVQTDPDEPIAELVGEYFGGSFGGRLNKAIRVANGGTYGAQGGFHANRLAGSFSIHTFTKTLSSAETLRMVPAQIQDLTNRPPDSVELSVHQRYFLGSAAGRFETAEAVAGQLEHDSLAGLPLDNMQRTCKAIAAADGQPRLVAGRENGPGKSAVTGRTVGPVRTPAWSLMRPQHNLSRLG
jgi:hypothetical protein